MAESHCSDDLPTVPQSVVRVAQNEHENLFALARFHMTASTIEDMPDEAIIALLEEPETYVALSPLERELVVRLGVAWEVIRRVDAEPESSPLCSTAT